jgi:hypothetical protein
MGRKRINEQAMTARFSKGTFERIDAVLKERETRSDLIREATDREVQRRVAIIARTKTITVGVDPPKGKRKAPRSNLVQEAIEHELERRERSKGRRKAPRPEVRREARTTT